MPGEGETDITRSTVKTYVPAYQKDEWKSHAEELGMSQSEFVRSMVQAGRRGFFQEHESSDESTNAAESGSEASDLEERVKATLSTDDHRDWEDLLQTLTDDIEGRLDETLTELQDENVVRYSGRHGGYTLVDE